MSDAKFTPGPWEVCGDGLRIKPVPKEHYFWPLADTAAVIRWCKEDGTWLKGNREEAKANAHLIAASPNLYAACEEPERRLRQCAENIRDEYPFWARDLEKMADKLAAVMAEARGEQP